VSQFRTTRDVVNAVVRITDAAAGRVPSLRAAAEAILTRIGVALLSQIQQDFITKSRGGVGRDGIQWKPLSPETIARRTASPKDEKAVRERLAQVRRRIFEEAFARYSTYMPAAKARQWASNAADQWMAAEWKKIRKEVLSARDVDILRDTGILLRSFSPGFDASPSYAEGQIFDLGDGRVTVGSSEKPWHQNGDGGRLPARPAWPQDGRIPAAWWPAIHVAAQRGIREAMFMVVSAGRV
jgi:hypothetical protein